MDYGKGGGTIPGSKTVTAVSTGLGAGAGAALLPATGSNLMVAVAAAMIVTLVTWGIIYAVKYRVN